MASNQTTPLVPYDPLASGNDDLLSALGLTRDQYQKLTPQAQIQIQYLQGLLGKLNSQDYANALNTIQGRASDADIQAVFSGGSMGDVASLAGLVSGLQSRIPAGYVAPPSPTSGQAAADAAVSSNQLPQLSSLGKFGGDLTGQDWQTMSGMLGTNAQQAYQAHVNSLNAANQNAQRQGKKTTAVPTQQQWFQQQLGNVQSAFAPLLQVLNAQYYVNNGTAMPVDLETQVVQQVQNMRQADPDAYNSLIAQMSTVKTSLQAAEQSGNLTTATTAAAAAGYSSTGALANLYNYVTSYEQSTNVEYQKAQLAGANASYFRSQTGKSPTQDQIQAMQGMNSEELNNYISSQPSDVQGVQLGAQQASLKTMETLWQQNFHRNPSHTEAQYFAGWSQNEITAWVNQQQSVDNPTMTIGERTGYLANADAVSQKLWGSPADSRIADLLDGHFNPNAPPPPAISTNPVRGIEKGLAPSAPASEVGTTG